jgi:hypothetical protein
VISYGLGKESDLSINFGYGIRATDYMRGSMTRNVGLRENYIEITVLNAASSEGAGEGIYNYKVMLMKY